MERKQKDRVRGVSGTMKIRVQKPTPETAPPSEPPTQRGRSASKKKNVRGRSPTGKFARQPCRDYLKGICTKSLCDCWHLPNVHSLSLNRVVNSAISARLHTGRLKGQPNKKPKKVGDQSAVAFWKDVRQLGCVFHDTEPPGYLSIVRKCTKVLGPVRRVRSTKATANIRENKGSEKFKSKFLTSAVMCPRRRVEIGQEYLQAQRNGQNYLLPTYQRVVSPSAIRNKTRVKIV